MSKVLGIDYGDKRIGIAISDDTQTFAFEKTVLINKDFQSVSHELKKIIEKNNISEIVLGLPLTLDGKYSDQTRSVKEFGEKLQKILKKEINYIDERLTSEQSQKIIKTIPQKKSRKKTPKDSVEARIILEIFLNQRKNRQNTWQAVKYNV